MKDAPLKTLCLCIWVGVLEKPLLSPLVGRETVFYTSCKQIVAQVTTTKFHFYVLQDGIEKIPEKL